MEENTTPEFRDQVSKRLIPLGRMCSIDEIGEAASFLASDRAASDHRAVPGRGWRLLTGFGEDLRPWCENGWRRRRRPTARSTEEAASKR